MFCPYSFISHWLPDGHDNVGILNNCLVQFPAAWERLKILSGFPLDKQVTSLGISYNCAGDVVMESDGKVGHGA
jgi:hypothetical protein